MLQQGRTLTRVLLIILAVTLLVGIGSSIDLTYIHYKVHQPDSNYKSFCNINDTINCDKVATSKWSTFFGIPIAILGGLTYFLSLLLLYFRFPKKKDRYSTNAGVYLFYISLFSVTYSLYLAWICLAEIGAWCIMCMVLYVVNIVFFTLAAITLPAPIKAHSKPIKEDIGWVFAKAYRIIILLVLVIATITVFSVSGYNEYKANQARIAEIAKRLQPVKAIVPKGGQIIANPQGKLTITIFSDYMCPFCQKTEKMLEDVAEKNRDVKLVRREFPLDMLCNPMIQRPFHKFSCQASYYALCAEEQGKYAAFHQYLLENQRRIAPDFLDASIDSLKLDRSKMNKCLQSQAIRDKVDNDIRIGLALEIPGTPVLVFDEKELLIGAVSESEVERIIELKLQSK